MYKDVLKIVIALIALVVGVAWGFPQYKVYTKEMRGRGDLEEARQNRLIMIEEASARLEAEKLNAQAEVERAKGMAEAMAIEGGALTPEYIHYLWVRSNQFNEHTTIYIPTEANLPILEAGRFRNASDSASGGMESP